MPEDLWEPEYYKSMTEKTYRDISPRMRRAMFDNVRKLILRGWTVRELARDDSRAPVDPWDKNASCWCLTGAMMRTAHDYARYIKHRTDDEEFAKFYFKWEDDFMRREYLERFLFWAGTQKLGAIIPDWNDRPGRTSREVCSLLDDLIQIHAPKSEQISADDLTF